MSLYRQNVVTLVPSQQDYTIGSGADFDGARPITLNGAFVTRGGIDYPLYVATQSEWNGIIRNRPSRRSWGDLHYEPTFPLGTVHVWYVPTEALPITLAVNMQLAAVADIGDTLVFPPGYERRCAMRWRSNWRLSIRR